MTSPISRARRAWAHADADVRRFTKATSAAGAVSLVVYLLVLWNVGWSPLRTALASGHFSGFYDLQGRSILDGDLTMPPGKLDIEAFVVDGREYMYFPPGPSLLRLPFLALSDAWDGVYTAPSMLLAWLLTVVLLALSMWRVRRLLRGRAPLGRGEAAGFGVLLATIACGSVLLYLAAMPWIYHEAYAWAIACSIGAMHCALGVLMHPSRRGVIGAGAFTLGAVLSRTTAGWACAGALVLAAAYLATGRAAPGRPARRWAPPMVLAGLLPLSVGIAINWAKFRHPYMFPLGDQVWTQVNDHRRAALAANGGDLVSTRIFPSTATAYARPDGIRFTSVFPFITLPAEPAPRVGDSFLDQTYRTGSVTAFMPLLTVVAAWGLVTAFRPRGLRAARLLRAPLLGLAAIPGAILFYGYIAYRYTSEVVPLLGLAGAVGYVDLAARLRQRSRWIQRVAACGFLALAAFGTLANVAVALGTARINSPGDKLDQYLRLQAEISDRTPDRPFDDLIAVSPSLPRTGAADRIQIVGDCTASYLGTGEPLNPWTIIDARTLEWEIDLSARPQEVRDRAQSFPLARARGAPGKGLRLHLSPGGRYRVTWDTGEELMSERWRIVPDDEVVRIRLIADADLVQWVVVDPAHPRKGVLDLHNTTRRPGRDGFHHQLIFDDLHAKDAADQPPDVPEGVVVRSVETPIPPMCARLLARYEQRG